MQLIRKARLYFEEGKSDKVYEVDLCDLGSRLGEKRYVVNFRYGRRGRGLREGTKTDSPVALDEANEIFDSVVVSKTNKGYEESGDSSETSVAESSVAGITPVEGESAEIVQEKRERIILDRLLAAQQKAISSNEIKRAVWRSGELRLRKSAAQIVSLIGTDDEVLDYCIAWSLGRCADSSVLPRLIELQKRYGLNFVGRMAREASLTLADPDFCSNVYQDIKRGLPGPVAVAIDSGDKQQIESALALMVQHPAPATVDNLADLYTLAREDMLLSSALCDLISQLELQPNVFKAVRQMYKIAEFRLDGKMLGTIIHKIETCPPYYNSDYGYSYSEKAGRYLKVSEEITKQDPAFAYSNRTRDYFRRRAWRSIKHLGQLQSEHYTTLAVEFLLAMSDSDAKPGQHYEYYDYDLNETIRREYDAYGSYMAFSYIMNLNNPRIRLAPSRRIWLVDGSVAEVADFRCEAFPELWDKRPQHLLRLMLESQCGEVHKFAVRALKCNKTFVEQLDAATLALLLPIPYEVTAKFALELVKACIKRGGLDKTLLFALVAASLEEARQIGRDVITARPQWFLDEPELMYLLIISAFEDNRLWMRRFATEVVLDEQQLQTLVGRLVTYILSSETGEGSREGSSEKSSEKSRAAQDSIISDISWMLVNVYSHITRQLGFNVIEDLLKHPVESVQMLAARILLIHATEAENLPPNLLRQLMEAESSEVRGLAVQLFGQLPDEILLAQPGLVVSLAVSSDAQVRRAARPIVARLSQRDEAFARGALQKLMGYLFLAEPEEGFHDDILQLVQTDLNHLAQELDEDTTWRLLQSKSKAAQRFGAHLLNRFTPSNFSVRQLARLGGHSVLAVRQWVRDGFNADVDRIKQTAQDALFLLESNWDDTRTFGFDFFNQHFDCADWTPELLISICDSVRNDVQNYGRELITKFFEEQHGPQYLLKLAQHPSENVQLFASNFLEQYATGNVPQIKSLRHYFVTVLSQVNKSRATKNRITRFLRKEALASEDVASMVADIFSRQSVTSAIGDKSACIDLLLQIQTRYPGLETPLQFVPIEAKSVRGAG